MPEDLKCPVCGGPARYVTRSGNGAPMAWCSEHAPAATPPWITIAQVVLTLALLAGLGFKLWGWFRR